MAQTNATIDTGLFINTPTAGDRASAPMARRALFGALLRGDSASVTGLPKPGIFPLNGGTPFKITKVASTLTCTIGPGWALTNRQSNTSLGSYIVGSINTNTVGFDPGDGTNYRVDWVFAQQADPEAGDGGHAQLLVVKGSSTQYGTTAPGIVALPAASTWPDGAYPVAYQTISPSDTTSISSSNNGSVAAAFTAQTVLVFGNEPVLPKTVSALPTDNSPYTRGDTLNYTGPVGVLGMSSSRFTGAGVTIRYNGSRWEPWETTWCSESRTNADYFSSVAYPFGGGGGSCQIINRWRLYGGYLELEIEYVFGGSGDSLINTGGVFFFSLNLPIPIDYSNDVPTPPAPGIPHVQTYPDVVFQRNNGGANTPSTIAGGVSEITVTNRLAIYAWRVDGTYMTATAPGSSGASTPNVPWTWAQGDRILINKRFPISSTYFTG